MKKKKQIIPGTPYLDKYKQYYLDGEMDCCGICAMNLSFSYKEDILLDLISPTEEDLLELVSSNKSRLYFGSDSSDYKLRKFTPLRQNLILLMAALNNEL